MRVIVTRPEEEAAETARKLAALGHEALVAPVLQIRLLPFALPDHDFQGVAVTSSNGVRALSTVLAGRHDAAQWRQRRVYAVGGRTAQAAHEAGFVNVLAPQRTGGVGVLAEFITSDADPRKGPLLYVSGRDVAGDLAGELSARNFSVTQVTGYAADAVKELSSNARKALVDGTAGAVLFYSARSASAFFEATSEIHGKIRDTDVRFLCLSPGVAAMMPETIVCERVSVAKLPEESALLDLLDAAAGGGSQA